MYYGFMTVYPSLGTVSGQIYHVGQALPRSVNSSMVTSGNNYEAVKADLTQRLPQGAPIETK